jgi:hypothetical protein
MFRAIFASVLATLAVLGPSSAFAQGRAWDRDYDRLTKALHKFAGKAQGTYMPVYPPLVSDAIVEGMGGPTDPVVDLPGGLRLISGCRAHSCTEKAAVILTPGYDVQAAAVIGRKCHWTGRPRRTRKGNLNGPSKCDSDVDVLTVFMPRSAQSDALDKALQDWARKVDPNAALHEIAWLK